MHSHKLLALAALGLAGCSNSPYPAALERGRVAIVQGFPPITYDPTVAYDAGSLSVTGVVNPGFFRYKYLRRAPFALELCLGAAMPTVQRFAHARPGQVAERWTCRLRKDLRFQDDPCFPRGRGRAISAADVVYALKRMADPRNESPLAGNVADKIVGWQAYADGFATRKDAQYDAAMPGIRVDPNDPYAFQIDLSQPYPQLKYILSMWFASPQAREAVARYGDQYGLHHPVGCGPFMLKEYIANDHILLVRNPNAPRELYPSEADPALRGLLADAGKPLPLVDAIYLPLLSEQVTTYNLFQQGYLDSLGVNAQNAQIVPAAFGLTQEMRARGVQMTKNVGLGVKFLWFNMKDPTFGGYDARHRKLRQAISLAIDVRAYIDVVEQGLAIPAEWMLPPGIGGYDAAFRNPYRRFDPKLTKAKALLAEAGYPDGVDPKTGERLTLTFDNDATDATRRQVVRLYQKQIEALGIGVVLNSMDGSTLTDRMNKHESQFGAYEWGADYPDAENFTFMMYGPNAAPGPNPALYDNPEYNRLFERMRGMEDGPARDAAIRRMRDVSVEDCPWILVDHPVSRTLMQPWVRNQNAMPLGADAIQYVDVDPAMRQRLQARWNGVVWWPLAGFVGVIGIFIAPAARTIRAKSRRRLRRRG